MCASETNVNAENANLVCRVRIKFNILELSNSVEIRSIIYIF